MTSDYDERRARFAEKEEAEDREDRKGEIKIGEITGKTTRDIERKIGGTKIRIDHVEDLYFQPTLDLKSGDSIKITIEADWTKRGQDKILGFSKREAKIGEAQGKVTGDIRKTDNVRVRIDHIEKLVFNPSADLKKGDLIRVTIDKV